MDASQLAGPLGGLVAAAFGAGCAAGWKFCKMTLLGIHETRFEEMKAEMRAEMDRRDDSCAEHIKELKERVDKWERLYLEGNARQVAAIRESAGHLIELPPNT